MICCSDPREGSVHCNQTVEDDNTLARRLVGVEVTGFEGATAAATATF